MTRKKVIRDECWLPQYALHDNYCNIEFEGKSRKSSVWSAIAFLGLVLNEKGHVPKGIEVCHKCHHKACWNPDHIYVGTRNSNRVDVRYDRLARCLDDEHILKSEKGKLSCYTCAENSRQKRVSSYFTEYNKRNNIKLVG